MPEKIFFDCFRHLAYCGLSQKGSMILHSHEDFVSLDRSLDPSFPPKLRIGIWPLIANQQHIPRIRSVLVSTFRAPIVMEKIADTEEFR